MTETTSPASAVPAEYEAETPNKGKAKTTKKGSPKSKGKGKAASHPPTSEMVNEAISSLNEKGGSSLQAIKKYISLNFKLDSSRANVFILKYIRNAVIAGKLVQTKGAGASGSFKFPGKDKAAGEKNSPRKPKNAPAKKEKQVKAIKPNPKKKTASKKVPVNATSPAKPKPKKLKPTAKPKKAVPAKKPASKVSKKKATPKKK